MIFTIAIPTYNNAKTIREAVKSSVNQDFPLPYEVLVVNNNCTDHTQDILDEFGDKIRVVKNPETVSVVQNHNICLQHAKGDYIIYCHSDDKMMDDALSKFHGILKKRAFPKKYVLWGRTMYRDYFENWKNSDVQLDHIASGIDALKAFLGGGLAPSGTCYDRKSFTEVGGFIETDHPLAPMDMVVMWKLVFSHFEFEMAGNIFYIREYASTAVVIDHSDWIAKATVAIGRFIDQCSEGEIKLFKEVIRRNQRINYDVYIALQNNMLISKSKLLNLYFRQLFLNPAKIFSLYRWKVLFKILKN